MLGCEAPGDVHLDIRMDAIVDGAAVDGGLEQRQ